MRSPQPVPSIRGWCGQDAPARPEAGLLPFAFSSNRTARPSPGRPDSGILEDGPAPKDPEVERGSAPVAFVLPAGLKPIADEVRKIWPFGSLHREGQHDPTRRNAGEDA